MRRAATAVIAAACSAAVLMGNGAAWAQDAGGGRSAPVAMPRLGGPAADPAQQGGGEQRRTVEAEGRGRTETEARSSAVRAAVEQVAGVYLEASSRSQLQASGSEVRDTFTDKVVAHSNGFVERVTTLQSLRTADGDVRVRVRADVVVNRMVDALRDAQLPLVPLDRDSTMVAFRTQTDRDATAREAILKYLADLPRNIEVQMGQVSLSVFAPDPNLVALTAPATLRVRPEYVERGHAALRDIASQEVEPPKGRAHSAFALCSARRGARLEFGSGGGSADPRSLECRGVPASKALAAEIGGVDGKSAVLSGEGFRDFVEHRDAQRLGARNAGRDVSPGVIFGVEALDASERVIAGAFNKVFTQCFRFMISQMGGPDEWMRSGRQVQAAHMGGRLGPVVNLFDERPRDARGNRPGFSPATCVLQYGGRYVGNAHADPERRTIVALLPRAAVERAANIRVVVDWD